MTQDNAQSPVAPQVRRSLGGMGRGEWLHISIDIRARRTLEHLATSRGMTERALLENLLTEAEQAHRFGKAVGIEQTALAR